MLTALGPCVHAAFLHLGVLNRAYSLTQTRIILFIYTHSHDEDGDLFYAPKDSSDDLTEVICLLYDCAYKLNVPV